MSTPVRFCEDDHAMLRGLAHRDPKAVATLYDRYAPHVLRSLNYVLGMDADVPDLLQEVFVHVVYNIKDLREPERLKSWLAAIAMYIARSHLRRRTRRRRLSLLGPKSATHQEPACLDSRDAIRAVYDILNELAVDDRLAFTLRHLEGLTLPDTAEACGVSLATIKRHLSRAEKRFLTRAQARPALAAWLQEGGPARLRRAV